MAGERGRISQTTNVDALQGRPMDVEDARKLADFANVVWRSAQEAFPETATPNEILNRLSGGSNCVNWMAVGGIDIKADNGRVSVELVDGIQGYRVSLHKNVLQYEAREGGDDDWQEANPLDVHNLLTGLASVDTNVQRSGAWLSKGSDWQTYGLLGSVAPFYKDDTLYLSSSLLGTQQILFRSWQFVRDGSEKARVQIYLNGKWMDTDGESIVCGVASELIQVMQGNKVVDTLRHAIVNREDKIPTGFKIEIPPNEVDNAVSIVFDQKSVDAMCRAAVNTLFPYYAEAHIASLASKKGLEERRLLLKLAEIASNPDSEFLANNVNAISATVLDAGIEEHSPDKRLYVHMAVSDKHNPAREYACLVEEDTNQTVTFCEIKQAENEQGIGDRLARMLRRKKNGPEFTFEPVPGIQSRVLAHIISSPVPIQEAQLQRIIWAELMKVFSKEPDEERATQGDRARPKPDEAYRWGEGEEVAVRGDMVPFEFWEQTMPKHLFNMIMEKKVDVRELIGVITKKNAPAMVWYMRRIISDEYLGDRPQWYEINNFPEPKFTQDGPDYDEMRGLSTNPNSNDAPVIKALEEGITSPMPFVPPKLEYPVDYYDTEGNLQLEPPKL